MKQGSNLVNLTVDIHNDVATQRNGVRLIEPVEELKVGRLVVMVHQHLLNPAQVLLQLCIGPLHSGDVVDLEGGHPAFERPLVALQNLSGTGRRQRGVHEPPHPAVSQGIDGFLCEPVGFVLAHQVTPSEAACLGVPVETELHPDVEFFDFLKARRVQPNAVCGEEGFDFASSAVGVLLHIAKGFNKDVPPSSGFAAEELHAKSVARGGHQPVNALFAHAQRHVAHRRGIGGFGTVVWEVSAVEVLSVALFGEPDEAIAAAQFARPRHHEHESVLLAF
jgi:hypothetical protein